MKATTLSAYALFLAAAFFPATANLHAATAAAAVNPDEVNAIAEPPATASADELVKDKIEAYFKKNRIRGREDAKGNLYRAKVETVSANEASANWGKSRVFAFEKAMHDAQADLIKDVYGKQLVESSRELFDNGSTDAAKFSEDDTQSPSSKPEAIAAKIMQLTEAELDAALSKYDVDTAQYKAKPLKQKQLLYKNAFIKRAKEKALGQIPGMIVAQTFTGSDGKGKHAVGVVMCYSERWRQVAHEINQGRIPHLTGKPKKAIYDQIPENKAVLADTFGIRVGFDEDGAPVILAYGQYSNNFTGKDSRRAGRSSEVAELHAQTLADSYITAFQDLNITLSNDTTLGEISTELAVKDRDGNESMEMSDSTTEILNRVSKARSQASMAGRRTVYNWSYTTPSGTKIYGVVRSWSVKGLQTAKRIQNFRPDNTVNRAPARDETAPSSRTAVGAGVNEGVGQDLNDF